MALYIYLKKESQQFFFPEKKEFLLKTRYSLKKILASRIFSGVVSGIFVILGLSMLSFVGMPMIDWQINKIAIAPEERIIRPIPLSLVNNGNKKTVEVLGKEEEKDLTHVSNWFRGINLPPKKTVIKEYSLSIPKLKIFNAHVIVGEDNLDKSLVHYAGTALPGEYGNAAIFGHSCLPQFYNPENYKCIFATLDTLEKGDEILVDIDDVEYKYRVYDFKTVSPDDIWILEQKFDNYYLSLVTCVPPGLDWKRLVVRAKLEKL